MQVRANPLPPGIYWVDAFGADLAPFTLWTAQESVRVLKTRAYSDPEGSWFLFEVLEPTEWNGPGFPTESSEETEHEDTVQRPDPETVGDILDTGGVSIGTKVVAGGVVLGLGIYLLRKL